jgi:hypothetical protein
MPIFENYKQCMDWENELREAYGLQMVLSIREHPDKDNCPEWFVPELNDVAVKDINGYPLPDEFMIVASGDKFLGGEASCDFEVKVKRPSWMKLWKLADEQMRCTCDYHHIFLEGIGPRRWRNSDTNTYEQVYHENGLPIYEFWLGS